MCTGRENWNVEAIANGFETWGPEVAGALIGAFAAGMIALLITRLQLKAQRLAELATTRRTAFGNFLEALGGLGESCRGDEEDFRSAHLAAVRAQQIWSMHLTSEDADVGEWVFEIEGQIVDIMKAVRATHPDPGDANTRLLAFFRDNEGGGETLFTGLHNHGVEWHREGGDVVETRAWFEEHASTSATPVGETSTNDT